MEKKENQMQQEPRMLVPLQVVETNIKTNAAKENMPLGKMMFLGILAGMFIAMGASASSVAMHSVANVGLSRVVGATIFPVGLMMIVLLGGELFTGDCLMIMAVADKKASWMGMIRLLVGVFFSNMIGSVIIAIMVHFSGQLGYSNNLLGAFTIKVAMGKVNLSFGQAFVSGILCNIFVCAGVLLAVAAKDVSGKIWAAFFPIYAFVVSGYEHCVANMYYIPAGILAKMNDSYVSTAMEQYGYTAESLEKLNIGSFLINSSIPVTLGNMVGGMVFVGGILYLIHRKNLSN